MASLSSLCSRNTLKGAAESIKEPMDPGECQEMLIYGYCMYGLPTAVVTSTQCTQDQAMENSSLGERVNSESPLLTLRSYLQLTSAARFSIAQVDGPHSCTYWQY